MTGRTCKDLSWVAVRFLTPGAISRGLCSSFHHPIKPFTGLLPPSSHPLTIFALESVFTHSHPLTTKVQRRTRFLRED